MKIFTIYDKKAKLGLQLFCAENVEVAKRIIISSMKEDSSLVHYAGDYDLVELGVYDTDHCLIHGLEEDEKKFGYPIKYLIPVALKKYCLDGSFDEGDENEKKA